MATCYLHTRNNFDNTTSNKRIWKECSNNSALQFKCITLIQIYNKRCEESCNAYMLVWRAWHTSHQHRSSSLPEKSEKHNILLQPQFTEKILRMRKKMTLHHKSQSNAQSTLSDLFMRFLCTFLMKNIKRYKSWSVF